MNLLDRVDEAMLSWTEKALDWLKTWGITQTFVEVACNHVWVIALLIKWVLQRELAILAVFGPLLALNCVTNASSSTPQMRIHRRSDPLLRLVRVSYIFFLCVDSHSLYEHPDLSEWCNECSSLAFFVYLQVAAANPKGGSKNRLEKTLELLRRLFGERLEEVMDGVTA